LRGPAGTAPNDRAQRPSGSGGGTQLDVDLREVDVGQRDVVGVIGQHVDRDVPDDLDDLRIAETGRTCGGEIRVRNLPARVDDAAREGGDGIVEGAFGLALAGLPASSAFMAMTT
jgi:hypothetical protein